MKKVLLVVFFFLLMCSYAFSEEKMKIGVVDLQYALNESDIGKKTKSVLESFIREKNTIINEKVRAKDKFREELSKQASALSESAGKTKLKELDDMEREIGRLIDESQVEVQKIQKNMEDEILDELEATIKKIGKEEDFDFVFPAGIVIYSRQEPIDLTEKVIQRYNELKTKSEARPETKAPEKKQQ